MGMEDFLSAIQTCVGKDRPECLSCIQCKFGSDCDSAESKDNLPIPKEVNRKKNEKFEAPFLAPANGYGHHFTKINYLSSF